MGRDMAAVDIRSPERVTRQAGLVLASRFLAYPDQSLFEDLPRIRELCGSLPASISEPIGRYLDGIDGLSLLELQAQYVSTFDLKRRCCLYLTYYLNGDTRRRGMALWRFQETFQMRGWSVNNGELPDFLPVLLEFAAVDEESELAARELLQEHREGLEVLRAALVKFDSPATHVVAMVLDMLPKLTVAQREAALKLVAQGPPTESVGWQTLQPFSAVDDSIGARS